jgi:hypothetical protein
MLQIKISFKLRKMQILCLKLKKNKYFKMKMQKWLVLRRMLALRDPMYLEVKSKG